METPMFQCDCGCETVCVTRIVSRCGEDGRAEHVIEVADGSRRSRLLAWRVVRVVVVGEFHLGGASVVRADVACARCGAPPPDPTVDDLTDRAGELGDDAAGDLVPLAPSARRHDSDSNLLGRARAVA
jgi:hypothetical protein